MHEFRADLHCHSTCSDGSDSPLELLHKAKEAKLSALSITDHDTIDAYTPKFFALAKTLGMQILPGIELSSEVDDTIVHVLGYGMEDKNFLLLRPFLGEMQRRRAERNRAICEKLCQRKMPLSEEEFRVFGKKTIGRPHIAELMVRKGYVAHRQEAFDRFLQEGGLCYVSGFKFTPLEVIEAIHKAQGKASLAHPHFFKAGSLLRHLLTLPFDGIECYYANLPSAMITPWLKIASEKHWIPTGGSDYHGHFKPHLSLGCSWVNQTTFDALRSCTNS